jgi:hypothetical protein
MTLTSSIWVHSSGQRHPRLGGGPPPGSRGGPGGELALACRHRINDARDFRYLAGGEAAELGVLVHGGLARGQVDAEGLVVGDEGLDPLGLARQIGEGGGGLRAAPLSSAPVKLPTPGISRSMTYRFMTTSLLSAIFDVACLDRVRQAWPVAELTLNIGENDRGEKGARRRPSQRNFATPAGSAACMARSPRLTLNPGRCARLGSALARKGRGVWTWLASLPRQSWRSP